MAATAVAVAAVPDFPDYSAVMVTAAVVLSSFFCYFAAVVEILSADSS